MASPEQLHLAQEHKENKAAFLNRLMNFPRDDRETIMFAYDIAKHAHHGQTRQTGERYFEHPRSVALILMDECRISDPSIIIGALLHDAMEDTDIFGSYHNLAYSDWVRVTDFRITKAFDKKTAETVIALTKPKIDYNEVPDDPAATKRYYENLANATPEALLIKMADRLHNLRTLKHTLPEKQQRKLDETLNVYIPLFIDRVIPTFPTEGIYLLEQIQKEIGILQDEQVA